MISEISSFKLFGSIYYAGVALTSLLSFPSFLRSLALFFIFGPVRGISHALGFFFSGRLIAVLVAQVAATVGHFLFASKGGGLVPQLKPLPKFIGPRLSRQEKFAFLWASEALLPQPGGSQSHLGELSSFVLLCALSGALSASALNGSSLLLGALVGSVHALRYLVRGRHLLYFPPVQRPRLLRLKQRGPSVLLEALGDLLVASATLLLFSALTRPMSLALALVKPLALARLGVALALSSLSLAIAAGVVEVVKSERIRFATAGGPLAALEVAKDPKNPSCVRALALMDVCTVAEDSRKDSWRRKAIFDTPTGAQAWSQVASACLEEVEGLTKAVGRCKLPTGLPAPATTAPTPATPSAASPSPVIVPIDVESAQSLALCHVQARAQQVVWSVRTLASLAAASRDEDKYGHLKLKSPGLKEVMEALLKLRNALAQLKDMQRAPVEGKPGLITPLVRRVGRAVPRASRPYLQALFGRPDPMASVLAVEDALVTCLYWIGGSFKEELRSLAVAKELEGDLGLVVDRKLRLSN